MSADPGPGAEGASPRPGRLAGKVAIVTGAAGGIGRAVVARLAAEGADIVATDLAGALDGATSLDGAEHAAAVGEGASGRVHHQVADVTSAEDWHRSVQAAIERFGGVDLLVSNAGIEGDITGVLDYPEDRFRQVLEVNVVGTFLGLAACGPAIIARGGGAVVNVASVAGLRGSPGISAYVASKHAVVGLTRSAALELGPRGVRVNAICPAPIETRMMRALEEGLAKATDGDAEAVHGAISASNPLGRYGEPTEVAAAVSWLCSTDAAYLNGVALPLDGGMTAR